MPKADACRLALVAGLLVSAGAAWGQAYYLCQDPQSGKKIAQDKPCPTGSQVNTYAPASAAELKAREETARQSKREFERAHPGTYRPEEYMTAEELADYQAREKEREKEREAERQRRETQQAIEAANRKAAQAEQRAIEAESAARQARRAAEEAASRNVQPPILPMHPMPLPRPVQPMPRIEPLQPPQPVQPALPPAQTLKPRLPPVSPDTGPCGRPDCPDDTSRPVPKRESAPPPTLPLTPRPL